jgi:hypothetical protein
MPGPQHIRHHGSAQAPSRSADQPYLQAAAGVHADPPPQRRPARGVHRLQTIPICMFIHSCLAVATHGSAADGRNRAWTVTECERAHPRRYGRKSGRSSGCVCRSCKGCSVHAQYVPRSALTSCIAAGQEGVDLFTARESLTHVCPRSSDAPIFVKPLWASPLVTSRQACAGQKDGEWRPVIARTGRYFPRGASAWLSRAAVAGPLSGSPGPG